MFSGILLAKISKIWPSRGGLGCPLVEWYTVGICTSGSDIPMFVACFPAGMAATVALFKVFLPRVLDEICPRAWLLLLFILLDVIQYHIFVASISLLSWKTKSMRLSCLFHFCILWPFELHSMSTCTKPCGVCSPWTSFYRPKDGSVTSQSVQRMGLTQEKIENVRRRGVWQMVLLMRVGRIKFGRASNMPGYDMWNAYSSGWEELSRRIFRFLFTCFKSSSRKLGKIGILTNIFICTR